MTWGDGSRSVGWYYDRAGRPLDMMTWAALFEDWSYRRIAETHVGPYRVSTVWLGLDHGFGNGPPVIFETMAFGPEGVGGYDLDCRRYSTEAAARAGHDEIVTVIRATVQTVEDVLEQDDAPSEEDRGRRS